MVRKSGMKNTWKEIIDSFVSKFWFDGQFDVYRDFEPATSTNSDEGLYFMDGAQIISGVEGALSHNLWLLF